MSQSLSTILVHLIYSTKGRERTIKEEIRDEFHRYTSCVLKELGSPALMINSVQDHVHVLYSHSKNHSLAKIVEHVKKSTSKWIKTKGQIYSQFYWQSGYGAFSVSQSQFADVVKYIANQQEHHRHKSFQEEYREFLERHQISYDERYVWD